VGLSPDQPAVACGHLSWTYRDLAQRSRQLAARLDEQGVRKGDVVAVAGVPSPLFAVAIPAIWHLGGVYLPIDVDQPASRLEQIISTASPVAVVTETDAAVPEAFAGLARVCNVAQPEPEFAADTSDRPACPLEPDDAAYVIFTSGSTGEPKGVLVGHRGIATMARELAAALGAGPGARVLQFAPTTFDASIAELTLALSSGATAVYTPGGHMANGEQIADVVSADMISHLIIVPSILETVPEHTLPGGLHILVAGERLGPRVLDRWSRRHLIRNAYGPTEATVCTTISPVLHRETVVPMGWAIPGTTLEIVDDQLRPVSPGTVGQLLIGGDGLALGYVGDRELTQDRFPTLAPSGARRYRSGDLVRELPDGQLEFVDRLDGQIKLRGRRIEPGDVESAILNDPRVRQARVSTSGDQLVAYVVASADVDSLSLKLDLAGRLPAYLVPDRVVLLAHLPVTRHGKADYRAMDATASRRAVVSGAARSPQEHLLCRIFADILGLRHVGRSESFFDLGGHSMLAAQLVQKVRATLGATLSMRAMLEAPTPAALADRLNLPDELDDSLAMLLPLRRSGSSPPLFCVHPSTGLSWGYAGLLPYLADRPVVGLQARAMTDASYCTESVEAMAADYLTLVRQLDATGPYHLLGYSFGGRVAFEMAVALQRMGEPVGNVMLLDSSPPPDTPYDASTENFALDAALREYFLSILVETSPVPDGDAWRAAPLPRIKAELDQLASPYSLLSSAQFEQMFELNKRNFVLSRRYVPGQPLSGRLQYVRAVGPDGSDSSNAAIRWAAHVDGKVVEHAVASTHNTMTGPNSLAQIGPLLAEELDRADRCHAANR
jgi:enterobactin synthetase component F